MNASIKKIFLTYLFFLFTTLGGHSTQAIEPSFTSNSTDQKLTEKSIPVTSSSFLKENNPTEKNIKMSEKVKKDSKEKPINITPASIEIPALHVRAEVVQVGKLENGEMGVPEDIDTIGWYEPGFAPGTNGNAVMAGHVDGASEPGAFFNLKKLEIGDEIHITGAKGKKLTFSVTEKQSYLPQKAPLERIFGGSSEAHLNLITCTGNFNHSTGNYEERLVIYTKLVES